LGIVWVCKRSICYTLKPADRLSQFLITYEMEELNGQQVFYLKCMGVESLSGQVGQMVVKGNVVPPLQEED